MAKESHRQQRLRLHSLRPSPCLVIFNAVLWSLCGPGTVGGAGGSGGASSGSGESSRAGRSGSSGGGRGSWVK